MTFRTTNCIALGVGDMFAAAEHYRSAAGWKIVKQADGWIEMESGALRIFLCADDETTPTFDLEVEDIEAARVHLEANGWTVSPLSKNEIYMISPFGATFALSKSNPPEPIVT